MSHNIPTSRIATICIARLAVTIQPSAIQFIAIVSSRQMTNSLLELWHHHIQHQQMLSSSKNVIALRSFINSSLLHTFFSSSWICMSVLQSSTVSCRGLVLENQYQLNNGWGHLNDQAIYHYISCRIPTHRNLEKISFSSVFKWKILKNLSLNIDSTLPLHFTLILDRTFINRLEI